mgnify:CR=1 FL=1
MFTERKIVAERLEAASFFEFTCGTPPLATRAASDQGAEFTDIRQPPVTLAVKGQALAVVDGVLPVHVSVRSRILPDQTRIVGRPDHVGVEAGSPMTAGKARPAGTTASPVTVIATFFVCTVWLIALQGVIAPPIGITAALSIATIVTAARVVTMWRTELTDFIDASTRKDTMVVFVAAASQVNSIETFLTTAIVIETGMGQRFCRAVPEKEKDDRQQQSPTSQP